jgi:hypothetical protein
MTAETRAQREPRQAGGPRRGSRYQAGWRLGVARIAVALVALAAVALYVVALPDRYAQVLAPCAGRACGAPASGAALTGQVLSPSVYAVLAIALEVSFTLVYLALALVLYWSRSAERMALFAALMLALWGLTFTSTMPALAAARPAWFLPVAGARYLGAALLTLFFFIFPDGRFAPGWARWLAAIWIISQAPRYFVPTSILSPDRWPAWLYLSVSAAFLGVMVALQVYRFRWRSSARQRRQTKWVLLGIAAALAAYVLALLAEYSFPPRLQSVGALLAAGAVDVSLLLLPLAIGIAILRDHLYDIDFLIHRTLVYGTLSATLAGVYVGSVTLSVAVLPARLNDLARVLATLLAAGLFAPLRRRIQRAIDRRFYRRRYNAARTLAAFSATLRNQVDLAEMRVHLVAVVRQTMQPEHVSLWLRPLATSAPSEPGSASQARERQPLG